MVAFVLAILDSSPFGAIDGDRLPLLVGVGTLAFFRARGDPDELGLFPCGVDGVPATVREPGGDPRTELLGDIRDGALLGGQPFDALVGADVLLFVRALFGRGRRRHPP